METLEKNELLDLKNQTSSMFLKAKELAHAICDATTENNAAQFLLESKRWVSRVVERLREPKSTAHKAWRNWCDLETELIEPHLRIEKEIIKPALSAYQTDQENKRRLEENRLRAERQKREEDARLEQAAQLEAAGEREQAQRVIEAPVVAAPIVLPSAPKPEGLSYREVWRFEVTNPDLIPREYMTINESAIGQVVRALKGLTAIPGIRVFSTKEVAGRIR